MSPGPERWHARPERGRTGRAYGRAPARRAGPGVIWRLNRKPLRARPAGRLPLADAIDDNERCLKDTIRVNPSEIAVRLTTYSGRYMCHCHILEHEDRDMMRPFVTMPAELMPFMA